MAKLPDSWVTIHNDFAWLDRDGQRILTRSGCLCMFNGVWYWYGGNQRGFREQHVYTSTDLVNWTSKGVVLRHDTDANRIDVLYNDKTKRYVMFLKYDGNGAFFAIATADRPDGQFTLQKKMLVDDARIGDMSMFKDDDGKAYLCYVSWAKGVNAQHGIYRMSTDYMSLDKRLFLWDIRGREAPHIFKRQGIYYYGTSKTAGIQSSGTRATIPQGTWKGLGRPPNRFRPPARQKLCGIRRSISSSRSREAVRRLTCSPATGGSKTRPTAAMEITSGSRWSSRAKRRLSTITNPGS